MAKRIPLPTQDYLLELFLYDENNGNLIWKNRKNKLPVWNKSWAGKVAGSVSNSGYINVGIDGKLYRAHRIIWKMVNGNDPESIDHINGDVSDNRISNLRDVSHKENHKNRFIYKTNKSGTTGVVFNSRINKWVARIGVDGDYIYLGIFKEYKDAVKARLDAESRYRFHRNHGRVSIA